MKGGLKKRLTGEPGSWDEPFVFYRGEDQDRARGSHYQGILKRPLEKGVQVAFSAFSKDDEFIVYLTAPLEELFEDVPGFQNKVEAHSPC